MKKNTKIFIIAFLLCALIYIVKLIVFQIILFYMKKDINFENFLD